MIRVEMKPMGAVVKPAAAVKSLKNLIFFNHQLSKEFVSGGEKMFLEVSKRFGSFGVESCSVVPEIAVETLKKENPASAVIVLPSFSFESNSYKETSKDMLQMLFIFLYRSVYGCFKVSGWLKESGAEVMYSTGDFIPDTLPPTLAKLMGKKVKWIMLIHHLIESPFKRKTGGLLSNAGSFLMQRFSFFFIRKLADGVFVKNGAVKGALCALGFDPDKVFIIDNGIDLERIKEMPSGYPEPFDCCYIGRLSASKGIMDLIEAWKGVVKEMPGARLAVIGGGSKRLEEEKKELIKELKLDRNISILGSLEDEDAYRIRKTSKLSLSCSYEEGWGITIAESLACGVPCVVYDLPVYKEKFGGAVKTVPRGDTAAFSKAVISLLEDSRKRKEMATEGMGIVQKYDINNIVAKEVGVIRSILTGE